MGEKLIFAVDDDPTYRLLYRSLLDAKTFKGPQELLTALKTEHPDLIISDLCMPFGDGYTMIDNVRKLDPTIPIIIATCMDGDEHKITAQKMHCGFWNKSSATSDLKELARCQVSTTI